MCGGGSGGGADGEETRGGGKKKRHGEMSRTDVTEGITWKKDGEKSGEGDVDGSERVPASEEDGARVIYMSELCVCVCVCVCERLCDTLPISSHPTCLALLSPLLSHPLSPLPLLLSRPFSPPLRLFTLTVIWQAWGWQTWSRQGKRLSGLALLGSCWLAEELAVRSGKAATGQGDWWGGEGELSLQWCDGVG